MLDGVRVLDLTQYLSGPTATLLLAGMGAEVIKIEPGPGGDAARQLPIVEGDTSSYFVQQGRGKQSVCLDLGTDEGCRIVAELAGECDVLVENFGHGVLEKRGLDHTALRATHPELIYASISAFGRTGSMAHLPGYDLIGQAFGGAVALTGEPDGSPIASAAPIADVGAGYMAFAAIGHALFDRTRTGQGCWLDVSMVESVFMMHPFQIQGPSVTEGAKRLRRSGRHFGSVPPAGTYKGPEGWLVLQVLAPQWKRLCEAAASIDLAADDRFTTQRGRADNRDDLVEMIENWMQTFPSDQALMDHLEAHRVPAGRVLDPADAHQVDWFWERGAIAEVQDPTFGTVRVPGFPIHVDGEVLDPSRPVPGLGEHGDAVLGDVLGYDSARIGQLRSDGILLGGGR
ncbi:MAG: CoA transferase [Actinomycetia bacterium]|nr:CoA transferase [Actinomycetes bacterium]MCP4083844.1 CoA transferase [Actinomycetes bacterium]